MIRSKLLAAAVFSLWLCAPKVSAADAYTIDSAHSKAGFSVTHMMINEVEGGFLDFSGNITWDEADMTKSMIAGKIMVTSINTDNAKRDEHLRSPDFFDAAKFPELTFKSTKIEKRGNQLVAVGDVTIKGVTKNVEIPFTMSGKITDPWGNTRIGIKGTLTINRKDFGMTWNKTLDAGGVVLGDEVKINLLAEAILQK